MADDKLLQAALNAARTGNLETAAGLFAQLVNEDPASEQGWLGLGLCISDKEKRDYCFRRVLSINPNNTQAKQALELLEVSFPAAFSANLQPPSSQFANPPTEDNKPAPAVSPFSSMEGLDAEPGESVFQSSQDQPVEKKNRLSPETPVTLALEMGSEPETSQLLEPAPTKKKKVKPLMLIAGLVIIFLLVCLAGAAYLFISGTVAQWLPLAPAPTWTVAQFPTQTDTLTPTITPTATLTATPAAPTPTSPPTPGPTLVYAPVFSKGACRFTPPNGVVVTCGYVTVPEDRSNLKSKSIQLAIEIFHSTNSTPASDPVVFLQGGPGGEAVQLSTDNYEALVKPFLSERDFVAFDQRGTGISIPALGCDDLEKVYKQDIGGMIPASSRELVYSNAFRSCHGNLTIAGIDLNAYTTEASSDDLKDIISTLGYKQVDLYSASYGTRLALVTLRDHPGIVRSVVLDSVVPIEVKLFNEDPIRYGSALQALFDACSADLNCNSAYPDLKTTFWNLVDQLDANPAKVTMPGSDIGNTGKFDGADLIGVILSFLKSSTLIGSAPGIIYQVKSGDYSIFSRMQSALPYQFQGINLGLYISMMCHEQILATSPQDLQAAMDSSQLDLGRYFRLPFFGDAKALFNSCKLWGAVPPAAGENATVVSSIPALVIDGKFDPVTPPSFGTEVVSNLNHAYSMEFPNLGHTPSASDSSGCAFETILAFFDNPDQQPDMTCLSTLKGVDFIVP